MRRAHRNRPIGSWVARPVRIDPLEGRVMLSYPGWLESQFLVPGRALPAAQTIAMRFGSLTAPTQSISSSMSVSGASSSASGILAAATPELPRVFIDTTYQPLTGRQTVVPAGADLQSFIDAAQPGDTLLLAPGATYNRIVLPNKAGAEWIHIRPNVPDSQLPAPGNRIDLSYVSIMPKIVASGDVPAITFQTGAHNYRFIGLEATVTNATATNSGIIQTSSGQTSVANLPHDLVFDRMYIHGNATGQIQNGVRLNSVSTAIIDSYFDQMHATAFESHDIGGYNGPGPYKIVNNKLGAATIPVLFGGAVPSIAGNIPSDIEFRHNYVSRPLSWRPSDPSYAGTEWYVKNLFELKFAQRVLIEGNIFEHNWPHTGPTPDGSPQAGYAMLFTVRDQGGAFPEAIVQDVTVRNNLIRQSNAGISVYGAEGQGTSDLLFENNLLSDIGLNWGNNDRTGMLSQIQQGSLVTFNHNTVDHDGDIVFATGNNTPDFTFTNNITNYTAARPINVNAGINGNGTQAGFATLNAKLTPYTVTANAMVGGGGQANRYPAGNFFPADWNAVGFVNRGIDYRLGASSPYKNAGTDGKDLGADLDAVDAATVGTASGIWLVAGNPTVSAFAAANITVAGATTHTVSVTYMDDGQIDVSTIDPADLLVSRSGGPTLSVTGVTVTPAGNGTPRVATYTLAAPGGTWDNADNGAYVVSLQPNQVFDTGGLAAAATTLGSFQVNVPSGTGSPAASAFAAANITFSGGTSHSITVTYADDGQIDASTIDPADLVVSRAGGPALTITGVMVTPAGNGSPRVATYTVAAPGGTWDAADNGTYVVSLQANQVFDTTGLAAGAATLGSFLVSIPVGSGIPVASAFAAANITVSGAATQDVSVTYVDDGQIDVSSIDAADLRVTRPGGGTLVVTGVTVTPAGNGSPRVATYTLDAPGGTWDSSDNGSYVVTLQPNQVFDNSGLAVASSVLGSFQVSLVPVMPLNSRSVVAGKERGLPPEIKAVDPTTGEVLQDYYAFASGFLGGVRVAMGDVNGDGTPDVIVGAGPGAGPHVKVFDGQTANLLPMPIGSFWAFDQGFDSGLYVASGDINGDGRDDVIVGADAGAGPHVRVFSGTDGTLLRSFFAFDEGFGGGVRVAAADVDADGRDDLVVGAGPGAGPHVKVFSGVDNALLRSFWAFDVGFNNGVTVAGADLDSDGRGDLVIGADAGAGPHVKVFTSPSNLGTREIASFFAFDPAFSGGVRVGAGDVNGDGRPDVLAATAMFAGHVKAFDLTDFFNPPLLASYFAYDNYVGGLSVGGMS